MVNLHPTTSIIILEVNVLHTPIKRQRNLGETKLKKKKHLYTVYKRHNLNIKTQIGGK